MLGFDLKSVPPQGARLGLAQTTHFVLMSKLPNCESPGWVGE